MTTTDELTTVRQHTTVDVPQNRAHGITGSWPLFLENVRGLTVASGGAA